MDHNRETEPVSLAEICEEKRLLIEKETGKTLERPVHFSSMGALIQGALSFVEFLERLNQKGFVYGSNDVAFFRFDLKTGALSVDQALTW